MRNGMPTTSLFSRDCYWNKNTFMSISIEPFYQIIMTKPFHQVKLYSHGFVFLIVYVDFTAKTIIRYKSKVWNIGFRVRRYKRFPFSLIQLESMDFIESC